MKERREGQTLKTKPERLHGARCVSSPCSLCFTPLMDADSTEHLSTMPTAAPTFVTYICCAVWMLDAVPHISLSRILEFYLTTYIFSVTHNLMHGRYQIAVTIDRYAYLMTFVSIPDIPCIQR